MAKAQRDDIGRSKRRRRAKSEKTQRDAREKRDTKREPHTLTSRQNIFNTKNIFIPSHAEADAEVTKGHGHCKGCAQVRITSQTFEN